MMAGARYSRVSPCRTVQRFESFLYTLGGVGRAGETPTLPDWTKQASSHPLRLIPANPEKAIFYIIDQPVPMPGLSNSSETANGSDCGSQTTLTQSNLIH